MSAFLAIASTGIGLPDPLQRNVGIRQSRVRFHSKHVLTDAWTLKAAGEPFECPGTSGAPSALTFLAPIRGTHAVKQ
jgi:hypothetical protein